MRPSTPGVGTTLGEYHLEDRLGRGGMGEVFVARALSGEVVALKYIDFATPTLLYRFKREFRALAEVHHPNIVSLGELKVLDDGRAYYTMEKIDGVPFVDHVRSFSPPARRLNQLLRATTQLVEAVCHLHEVGYIHRDIKPSNVLVTPSGRVVLLDFGLVSEYCASALGISHTGQLLGTPAYMAPEQAQLSRCRPGSDFYSVGVMLCEALYGRRPVVGNSSEVLWIKRHGGCEFELPPSPSYPERLRQLCRELLLAEVWERPSGQQILQTLRHLQRGEQPDLSAQLPTPAATPSPNLETFVGRERELGALLDAHEAVQSRRQTICVRLTAASGLGKSTLLNKFLERLLAAEPRPVILRGRCLERESVPYRGIDEIVDALSLFLRKVPLAQRLSLQPRHAGALARLFPVLGQIWPTELPVEQGPSELRDAGIVALREVLVRLADRHALVLAIDDFHRADRDGQHVLVELLRSPNAPTMLVVVAGRDELRPASEIFGPPLEADAAHFVRHELSLEPLAQNEASQLVRAVLTASGYAAAKVEALVAESAKQIDRSPFALCQWTLGAMRFGPLGDQVEDVVMGRIKRLSSELRDIVSLVALAGGPVPIDVIAEAAGGGVLTPLLNRLCAEHFLVRSRVSEIDTAHDKIRTAAVERLSAVERRPMHRDLATAMAHFGTPAEILVEHLVLAGSVEDALTHALSAAQNAARSLAFSRAITFYQRVLELLPAGSERLSTLQLALAEQLANDGRGVESSELFVEVAARSSSAAEARELRRRGALLLLLNGRIAHGLDISSSVLAELGERLPRGHVQIGAALVCERVRLSLAWRRWRQRLGPKPPADARTSEVITSLLTAVRGLGAQEHVLAYLLQSRALRIALEHEASLDLVMLVGAEMLTYLARGRIRRSIKLREIFEQLALPFAGPEFDVLNAGIEVISAGIELQFDLVAERGPWVWSRLASYPSTRWFRSILCSPLAYTWVYIGDFEMVRRECRKWLTVALERGNNLQAAEVASSLVVVSIYSDDVEGARKLLKEAEGYVDSSFFAMSEGAIQMAHAMLLAYEGQYEQALAMCKEITRRSRRAGLLQLRLVRCILEDVRGRCELARMVTSSQQSFSRRVRRVRVMRSVRWLQRRGGVMGVGFAAVLEAGLASNDGDEDRARGHWGRADIAFSVCGLAAHQAVVRHHLGQFGEDPGSKELRRRAQVFFEAQGIKAPMKFVELLAPRRLPDELLTCASMSAKFNAGPLGV